jgi:hypothetical protein
MMFALLKKRRSSTFALAQYGKEYLPTRERSREGASVYTYKSTWDGLNYNPVSERKNRSEQFSSSVFGTIREVLPSVLESFSTADRSDGSNRKMGRILSCESDVLQGLHVPCAICTQSNPVG